MEMERKERVRKAEALVEIAMKGNDASHDAAHVWRVRDLALSLASEEGLSSNPHSMEIVTILRSSYFYFTIIKCTFCFFNLSMLASFLFFYFR